MTKDEAERMSREQARWESETLKRTLDRGGERQESFATTSTETRRLYTPLDVAEADYERDVGFPGEYPYTRGIQPTMYRGRLWSIRQYAGYGTPEETNQRFKFLLNEGQPGLSVAFDLPTQLGHDSDDHQALGEVGKVGVAIDTLRDMETVFDGIPLEKVSSSMTINAPAAILVAMYQAVGEKQGVAPQELQGTVQNDVLKEYVARGTYIFPPRPSMRLAADLIAYCSHQMPRFNSISIGGYHIRDAGSTAVQEMAFTFANAIAYIEAALQRGVEVDDFAPRISWIFNTQNSFFEEVAKYRALRRMWARIMRERFGAKDPRSWMFRTHVQTGGATLTAQQPENNIVRTAIQALAAVLGGTQSLHTNSMDEALALPTEKAVQIALRTQQIIAEESGAANTVDPLGGSFFVESQTNRIETQAYEYFGRIADLGGVLPAIDKGFFQSEISDAAYRYQREIDENVRRIVGVNAYPDLKPYEIPILRMDPQGYTRQVSRLEALRKERDNGRFGQALDRLRLACQGTENTMPYIMDAVRAYATLGEIIGVMKEVFGIYQEPTWI